MGGRPDLSLFDSQVREFISEMNFLYQELISIKSSIESGLPEDIRKWKRRIKAADTGDRTRRTDDYYLFFKICSVLSMKEEPLTMGEMSAALEVTLSMATRLVTGLVSNGYVVRLPDPDDRRVVRVALTDKGKNIFTTINDSVIQRSARTLTHFSEDERVLLIRLLRRLAENLREHKQGG